MTTEKELLEIYNLKSHLRNEIEEKIALYDQEGDKDELIGLIFDLCRGFMFKGWKDGLNRAIEIMDEK